MNIDETNTPQAIKDYYSELVSNLFVLAARRPDLKNSIGKEILCILNEQCEALKNCQAKILKSTRYNQNIDANVSTKN